MLSATRRDAPYYLVALALLVAALVSIPTIVPRETAAFVRIYYAYAPGYFAQSPRLGAVRVVPLANYALKSPVARKAGQ